MFTAAPVHDLSRSVGETLARELGHPVDLHLTQILATGETPPELLAQGLLDQRRRSIADSLRAGFPLPLAAFDADLAKQHITLVPRAQPEIGLIQWQLMEADLATRHEGWTVRLLPPPQNLPTLYFARASADIDETAQTTLEGVAWAMQRWQQTRLELIGYASTDGGGSLQLARARVDAVAARLRAQGLVPTTDARYPLPGQTKREREIGHAPYRAVTLALPAAVSPDATSAHPADEIRAAANPDKQRQ